MEVVIDEGTIAGGGLHMTILLSSDEVSLVDELDEDDDALKSLKSTSILSIFTSFLLLSFGSKLYPGIFWVISCK